MRLVWALLAMLSATPSAAQPARLDADAIRARLAQTGRVDLAALGLVVERFDFAHAGGLVEAVVVRPVDARRAPGLVLVPGHARTATDLLPQAIRFARAGFATVAVSQPGYGRSTGPADFAGPRTFAALAAATERFARAPYVDRSRLGIYGYSRGALAAAQLAARTDLFRASVLGGGIYDFRTAYDQIALPGIRDNMAAEAGLGTEAVRLRSPIPDMEGLDGPVLIVHGEADANAPPAQARALAARLTALGRDHELVIVPGAGHGLAMADIIVPAIAFFQRHLAAASAPGHRD